MATARGKRLIGSLEEINLNRPKAEEYIGSKRMRRWSSTLYRFAVSTNLCSSLSCAAWAQPLHDLEIALDPIGSELVWMRPITASSEHSVLVHRIVELRVV